MSIVAVNLGGWVDITDAALQWSYLHCEHLVYKDSVSENTNVFTFHSDTVQLGFICLDRGEGQVALA